MGARTRRTEEGLRDPVEDRSWELASGQVLLLTTLGYQAEDGGRKRDKGPRTTDLRRRWEMEDGRWKMGDGRWEMEAGLRTNERVTGHLRQGAGSLGLGFCGRPGQAGGPAQFARPAPGVVVEVQVEQFFDVVEGGGADDDKEQKQEQSCEHQGSFSEKAPPFRYT